MELGRFFLFFSRLHSDEFIITNDTLIEEIRNKNKKKRVSIHEWKFDR